MKNNLIVLKEIREAFQWTWDNMDKPHTSDHFNIPASGIQALDNLIEAAQPSSGNEGEENRQEALKHLMALVRVGYSHAVLEMIDFCKGKDLPGDLMDKIIDMLNSESKKKFSVELFKKELEDFAASHTPEQEITYDEIMCHDKWDEMFEQLKQEGYSNVSEEESDKIYDECKRRIREIIIEERKPYTHEQEGEDGYWKKRCEAAEYLISPVANIELKEAYDKWQELKSQQ